MRAHRSIRRGKPRPAHFDSFAADLDGTLTTGGKPIAPAVADSLRLMKERGVRLLLVTGRSMAEVRQMSPRGLFDGVVAENGALLAVGRRLVRTDPSWWPRFRARLVRSLGPGPERVIVSAEREKLRLARRLVVGTRAGIQLNKDRLMVLPPGVDKGTGFLAALSMLKASPGKAACVGDGENDVPMFRAAGYRIALLNSVGQLKKMADFVSPRADGEGTRAAIFALLDPVGVREGPR